MVLSSAVPSPAHLLASSAMVTGISLQSKLALMVGLAPGRCAVSVVTDIL